jgi:integrase
MPWTVKYGDVWYLGWRENGHSYTRRVSKNPKILKAAKKALEERLECQRWGVSRPDASVMTVMKEYIATCEARTQAGDLAASTVVRIKEAVAHFQAWLEQEHPALDRLSQLDRAMMRAYQLARAASVKAKTVNVELVLLGGAFRSTDPDRPTFNPLRGLPRLKERDSVPGREITEQQGRRLLRKSRVEIRPYLAGYLYTGARRSELQAMEWSDVDFRRMTLRLQNIKTRRGASDRFRVVPLHPALAIILKRRRALPQPWPKLTNESLRRWFLEAAKAAGLPTGTRLHDLRHAYASALVSAGVDLYAVSKLLGHRSASMSERYSHLNQRALREAVGRIRF